MQEQAFPTLVVPWSLSVVVESATLRGDFICQISQGHAGGREQSQEETKLQEEVIRLGVTQNFAAC